MLSRESLRGFLPAKRLSQQVASQLIDRAGQKIAAGESMAGWADYRMAERLGASTQQLSEFRNAQAVAGIDMTKQLLEAGETELAGRQIAKLEQLRLGGDERRRWKQIVQLIGKAKQMAFAGEFAPASEMLGRAEQLLPDQSDALAREISSRRAQLAQEQKRFKSLTAELHEALSQETWSRVLTLAEELIELTPDYQTALSARKKAWQAVGIDAGKIAMKKDIQNPAGTPPNRTHLVSTIAWPKSADAETMTNTSQPGKRLIAWIDEVGGFLICMSEEVTIGQPASEGGVDIPVRADLSRRHATLRRDGEHYVLTPIYETKIDGNLVTGPTLVRHGALIELGESLRLRFTRPHSLSTTAVLQIESKHKTELAVDSVILMSESCVLGPRPHSHIRCPGWENDLVLFRRGDQLRFRSTEIVELNDHPGNTSGIITANCRLVGGEFALSFEEL